MWVLEKHIPMDIIKDIHKYVPNNHVLNKYSLISIYLNSTKSLLYIILFSPKSYLLYGKSHYFCIVKIGKLSFAARYNTTFHELNNKLRLPKDTVEIITTTWYINKKYKDLVYTLFPTASFSQKIFNAYIQMGLICIIKMIFIESFDPIHFCFKYACIFLTILFLRFIYEKSIVS